MLREVEGRGSGSIWEGAIIRLELYLGAGKNSKFIPVLFGRAGSELLPRPLLAYNCYRIPDDFEALLRVLTAQRPVVPEPIGQIPVLAPSSYSGPDFKSYRMALETRAKMHDWWNRAIPLDVSLAATNEISEARNVLNEWLNTPVHRHCIVLGDPGAGKTGLLWWTASILAKRQDVVPLFVPASKLRALQQMTLPEIGKIAEPPLKISSESQLGGSQLFLLLDGLDELVGAEAGGDKVALELITKIFQVVPPSSRVIAACRTPAFAIIDQELKNALPANPADPRTTDPYDQAISRALGLSKENPLIIQVRPVSKNSARIFLEEVSVASDLVQVATSSSKILPFLSSPFSLRLLTLALPHLVTKKTIAIDDLYRIYVTAALVREDPALQPAELDQITAQLRHMVFSPQPRMDARFLGIAQRAGLIAQRSNRFEFSHYSLWEYFFASELLNQISKYDSMTLARLDLVSAYNINRMLVPMVLRTLAQDADASVTEIRAVAASEYRRFTEFRGWRKRTGYGIHPSMLHGSDGTPSATFSVSQEETRSVHRDHRHGDEVACALSWYDAAVFALHARSRLPTSVEIQRIDCNGDYLFWCSDWHTEEIAHVCVFDARKREIRGANPDVRLPQTALAVIGKAG